jgi:hypothetical protein
MKRSGMVRRFALRGLTAGTAAAIIVHSFTAYLDPTVFMPMLSVFAFCQ